MGLQSKQFRGDPKLEACLVNDAAHIIQGAVGDHVSKIQKALFILDGCSIAPSELSVKKYGSSTAAAVLAFKKKRNIINLRYQTQPDNIVGRMTIDRLDKEMVLREGNAAPPAPPPVTPGGTGRTCNLPPSSTFATWPPDLIETLCQSYKTHAPGNRYLDNAFWGGEPSDFEDALNRLGVPVQNNALKWVHSRASAIHGLWPFIQYVHNLWSTDSHGFAFTCTDKTRLRHFLDASSSFCRDTPIMQSDHQAAGPTQCWREIVNSNAGLHICIPINDTIDQRTVAGESNIHIDPHQIVEGKEPNGICNYSAIGAVAHGKDVGAGVLRRKLEELIRRYKK